MVFFVAAVVYGRVRSALSKDKKTLVFVFHRLLKEKFIVVIENRNADSYQEIEFELFQPSFEVSEKSNPSHICRFQQRVYPRIHGR